MLLRKIKLEAEKNEFKKITRRSAPESRQQRADVAHWRRAISVCITQQCIIDWEYRDWKDFAC